MKLILFIVLILLIAGIREKQRHTQRLRQIPIRIHINGIRGKSLLTRMLVDLFTAAGWNVAAKVTGEKPQFYSPATGWRVWQRKAPARIQEQISFIRRAYQIRPQAIIIENMALEPENLFIAENSMIKSTLSIFTNFRMDHQEIMGQNLSDIARTLSYALPNNSIVVMPASELSPQMASLVEFRGNRLFVVDNKSDQATDCQQVFRPHFEILKEVARLYTIPQEALEKTIAFWKQQLKPERFLIPFWTCSGQKYLVNLFTCNDVTSTAEVIAALENSDAIHPPYSVIFACRSDRPLRSEAFLQWLCSTVSYKQLIVAGSFPRLRLRKCVTGSGNEIIINRWVKAQRIISHIHADTPYVLGLGNFNHAGEKIISHIEKVRI